MDVRKSSLDILRDLYASSRRLNLYPLGHKITQDTLKKPLETLNNVFSFKHSFTIELFKDIILTEGICLEDTIYVSGLALDMKKHKLSNMVFYSHLTVGDLYHFLTLLLSKPGPYDDNAARVLKSNNIDAIGVNVDRPPKLYDFNQSGTDSGLKQYPLDKRARQIIVRSPGLIAAFYLGKVKTDEEIFKYTNVDFRFSFLSKLFRDALLETGFDQGKKLLEEAVYSTNWLDDEIRPETLNGIKRLFADFLSRHKDEKILSDIYQLFKKVGAPNNVMEQIFSKSSVLKLKTYQDSERIIGLLECSDPSRIDPLELKKTVFKLAASEHHAYFGSLINQLLKLLSGRTIEIRQKGLNLVEIAAEVLARGKFEREFNYLCRESVRLALTPSSKLEAVELASALIWHSLKEGMWQELKFLAGTLKGIRDDKTQPANKRDLVSRKLIEISESNYLSGTFSTLLEEGWTEDAKGFFDAFSSLGAGNIVRSLADKITHPDINMRSRVIKLLVSMKKDSANILSQILGEQVESSDGKTIDEEKWYFFRNILRVLREVRAEESLPYIEIMTNWPDSRLKMEIIKTLEEMPVENAGKLLEKLAGDDDPEIRKAAVVAIGLTGHPDMVPRLLNIFLSQPDCRINAIAAMGRIGGAQARDMLIQIFEDESYFVEYDVSKKDSEQIRVAVLKALSRIGDRIAREKLEDYSRGDYDQTLFSKDLISNTAKVILGSIDHK